MALGIVEATREAMLDAIDAAIGTSGLLRIYGGGSGRPATGAAITDQTLLAECPLSTTAFEVAGTAVAGEMLANAITDDTILADGTANWFRFTTSGGAAVFDGSVSTTGADLNFDSTSFVTGGNCSITSFKIVSANA